MPQPPRHYNYSSGSTPHRASSMRSGFTEPETYVAPSVRGVSPTTMQAPDPEMVRMQTRIESPAALNVTHYTFQQLSYYTMGVVAAPASENQAPKYIIEVALNCFNPSSFITTVWTNEPRFRVGEFVLGTSFADGSLEFDRDRRGHRKLSEVFRRAPNSLFNRNQNRRWEWRRDPHRLIWEKSAHGEDFICHASGDQKTSLAMLRHSVSGPPTSLLLEVSAAGHEVIDDILMSALLVERKRQCPGDEES